MLIRFTRDLRFFEFFCFTVFLVVMLAVEVEVVSGLESREGFS
jgi:hypothetical protein